jgi:hypothetical protein
MKTTVKLRLHIHHVLTGGWCADIDDDTDRQPDDPYWCTDGWPSLTEAVAAGCTQLAALYHRLDTGLHLPRVSGRYEDIDRLPSAA